MNHLTAKAPSRPTPTTPHRLRGDDGAALVEAAIVAPLLILLVMGMAEMGLAWRTSTEVSDAVRQAALDASAPAGDRYADVYALENIGASIDPSTIQSVTIYKAGSGTDGTIPTGCEGAGTCNVYDADDVIRAINGAISLNDTSCAGALDQNWCPLDRDVPDQVGVHVVMQHEYITGFLPSPGITIEDHSTFPVLKN